jgi:hypothetical protein
MFGFKIEGDEEVLSYRRYYSHKEISEIFNIDISTFKRCNIPKHKSLAI